MSGSGDAKTGTVANGPREATAQRSHGAAVDAPSRAPSHELQSTAPRRAARPKVIELRRMPTSQRDREAATEESRGATPDISDAAAPTELGTATGPAQPLLDVVVPVYNEQRALQDSVLKLRDYLDSSFPFRAVITIADNASTDATWWIARHLADTVADVRAVHLDEKGRGRALRAVWTKSNARVVAYMDVDLATDLRALLPLVAPLLSGHSDVAIGSRLARGARVTRGPKREMISRCYNLIVKTALHTHFSDAQCGFKALRGEVAHDLAPQVTDDSWFFDTELLVVAERRGLRIHEVPVDWVDDPDSRVNIRQTVIDDLKGIWRLMCARPSSATRRPGTVLHWHERREAPTTLPRQQA